MLFSVLIILGLIWFYIFLKRNYRYWSKRGIKGPKPMLPFGNLAKTITFRETPGETYNRFYNMFQNEKIVGLYRCITPVLLIRDPDLIKEVTIKSFVNFHDNDINIDKNVDPLLGRHPFMLKGEEWKTVRAQLTPNFTTGKMKSLYPLLEEISTQLVKFIENCPETTNGDGYEAKELSIRYTLNTVASCAFGLEGKCLEEGESEFRKMSKEFISPGGWLLFAIFLTSLFPFVSRFLPVRLISRKVEKKLVAIVTQTLKYREEENIVRNDFLQFVSELKANNKGYEFTDLDITAHSAGFFADGSEVGSIVMSFVLFELAADPEAQEKVRDEVNSAFGDGEKLTYEGLHSLEYLDACINEALRLHPPVTFFQKICTRNSILPLENENIIVVEKGTPIILPVFGLQRDARYYQEPNSFKPERFLRENRDNLKKYTFLPFGEGPRGCLGKRFGVLQIKVAIAYIIRNFELTVNKKTQLPIRYAKEMLTYAVGGLWLNFKRIQK